MSAFFAAALPASAASLLVYYDGTASGTTLLDQSGNGRNAAFDANGTTGTTATILTTTPANAGSGAYVSLTANGTNQSGRFSVTPTGGFSYDFNNQSWSVSMFYNRQSTATHDTLFHVGAGDGFGGENELYAWATGGSTNLNLQHYPLDVDIGSSGKMNLNAWHHMAMTFTASGLNDGTGLLSFYVDGALIGTDNSFTLGTNNSFFFGGQGSGTADRNFIGYLDDMALFGGVLTASEVTNLANGSQTPISLVPEPGRAALLLMSLVGLMMRRRRR